MAKTAIQAPITLKTTSRALAAAVLKKLQIHVKTERKGYDGKNCNTGTNHAEDNLKALAAAVLEKLQIHVKTERKGYDGEYCNTGTNHAEDNLKSLGSSCTEEAADTRQDREDRTGPPKVPYGPGSSLVVYHIVFGTTATAT
eukprot:CAMPEP_0170097242 /NCGR_PEP_ID=MMETSP0019_2-20121128/29110_1 /TAXON_ID=98059 /ORGANISM="Dinobryon sp., Strain UTEXLB2267" /LENGTH=141 /DNA_ID=CAMNT_0010319477 /DNA_START=605 /DNA_END=1031 /DNA_ORIENTATION=-